MADYDPSMPSFDAVTAPHENGNEYQYDQTETDAEEEEDDDYDPSSFNFDDVEGATVDQPADSNAATTANPVAPTQKTIGGFIIEDDEDDEEDQQDAAVPPPSQMNGTEGAQSGLGAVAISEAANDIPVASEPQEDASAQSAAPLTGSSSLVVPPHVSEISVSSNNTLSAPTPSFQTPDQGKRQLSTAASAVPSATGTPQPPVAAAAPAPPTQINGSVPQTPTTQRLPHDKVGQLEDRIKEDPKADTEAWRELIKHYRDKGQLDNVRRIYDRFFQVFPSAVCNHPHSVFVQPMCKRDANSTYSRPRCGLSLLKWSSIKTKWAKLKTSSSTVSPPSQAWRCGLYTSTIYAALSRS